MDDGQDLRNDDIEGMALPDVGELVGQDPVEVALGDVRPIEEDEIEERERLPGPAAEDDLQAAVALAPASPGQESEPPDPDEKKEEEQAGAGGIGREKDVGGVDGGSLSGDGGRFRDDRQGGRRRGDHGLYERRGDPGEGKDERQDGRSHQERAVEREIRVLHQEEPIEHVEEREARAGPEEIEEEGAHFSAFCIFISSPRAARISSSSATVRFRSRAKKDTSSW